nr:hypothetical protein [Campylobacter concisus]
MRNVFPIIAAIQGAHDPRIRCRTGTVSLAPVPWTISVCYVFKISVCYVFKSGI